MNVEKYIKELQADLRNLKKQKQTKRIKESIKMTLAELEDFEDD